MARVSCCWPSRIAGNAQLQHLLDQTRQAFQVERFLDESIHSQTTEALRNVQFGVATGEQHLDIRPDPAQFPEDTGTIHARHALIKQHQPNRISLLTEDAQRLLAISRHQRLESKLRHHGDTGLPNHFFIVNDQDQAGMLVALRHGSRNVRVANHLL